MLVKAGWVIEVTGPRGGEGGVLLAFCSGLLWATSVRLHLFSRLGVFSSSGTYSIGRGRRISNIIGIYLPTYRSR